MVEQPLKIVWDNEAKEYLKKTIQYIRLDSPQNADKVAAAIKEWLKILTKYPPDKYRITNPDNKFRALTHFYTVRTRHNNLYDFRYMRAYINASMSFN